MRANYDFTIIGTEINHLGWTIFIIKGEERRIEHFVNNHLKTDLVSVVMNPFWSFENTYEITVFPKDEIQLQEK